MSKQWTLEDDIFLFQFHEIGADYVASHDLGHHGKGAGTKRIKALKAWGVWEKIEAHVRARAILVGWHTLSFSRSGEAQHIAAEQLEEIGARLPSWALEARSAEISDFVQSLKKEATE